VLQPTRPEERANIRLIYRLNFRRKHPLTRKVRNKPVTLVFYDISGDLLRSRLDITTSVLQYLWHSAGIIYLVNPLYIPEVSDFINPAMYYGLPEVTSDDILYNVVVGFQKHKDIRPGERIKVPLAVCLSQSDRLRDINHLLNFDQRLFQQHRHNGAFDTEDFKVIDAEIRAKLHQWGGVAGNLLRIAESSFKTTGFFAASALGAPPDKEGRVDKINPIRMEDPFLWILAEIGLIGRL